MKHRMNYSIGDRVRTVSGEEHGEGMSGEGVIAEISTSALGIKFDGQKKVHHWYVASELEPVATSKKSKHMTIAAKDKETKQAVNYRMGTAKEHCSVCTMYRQKTGSCSAVKGMIARDHVCDLFERKKGE